MKEQHRDLLIISSGILLIALAALVEFTGPPGLYLGGFYILAILITFFSSEKIHSILISVCAVMVVLLNIYFFRTAEDYYLVSTNLTALLAGIFITMFFVLFVKNIESKSREESRQIIALLENATEGIILSKSSGEIIYTNPHAISLFRYEPGELNGKSIDLLIPLRARNRHAELRAGFNQNPVNRMMGVGRDLYAVRKDGTEFPVEISLSHYTHNKQSFVIAFIIDITQRKHQEHLMSIQRNELEKTAREINELNFELESKVSARTKMLQETLNQLEQSKEDLHNALEKEKELSDLKSRFVSMASHEFRTPLSSILSSAALIGKYPLTEQQEQRDKHIGRIKDSVRHLNSILEDLLSIGRLEEGKVQVKVKGFDYCEFLQEVIDEVKVIATRGQVFELICHSRGEVYTDKTLLRNVLTNLLSNAVKFSRDEGLIKVDCSFDADTIRFNISDSGIGISEADQEHLFERFYRAKNASNIQGTGLGLFIVKRYLDLLGGNIQFKSVIDVGTTFIISLPQLKSALEEEHSI